MKVCETCGTEISTKDGINICTKCEEPNDARTKKISRKRIKQERESVYETLGLIKCKGSLGGTYWE